MSMRLALLLVCVSGVAHAQGTPDEDRFFVDKSDDGKEDETLWQGSLTSTSFLHRETAGLTRVGAADNLARGESTFMVEMRETAAILKGATRRSLVILDEVGRGTSTFDGVSIAWAVTEYLHDAIGARTLFATHYHELCTLADTRPRVRNVSVAVREHGGEIVFLRQVVEGGASRSYGIDVARLAGLPRSVISRGRQILDQLEGGRDDARPDDVRDRGHGIGDTAERGAQRRLDRWLRHQPQDDLRDDRQRAFRADEQVREVVADDVFHDLAAGFDDFAGRQHGLEPEHVLLRRAVLERARASGAFGHVSTDDGLMK